MLECRSGMGDGVFITSKPSKNSLAPGTLDLIQARNIRANDPALPFGKGMHVAHGAVSEQNLYIRSSHRSIIPRALNSHPTTVERGVNVCMDNAL